MPRTTRKRTVREELVALLRAHPLGLRTRDIWQATGFDYEHIKNQLRPLEQLGQVDRAKVPGVGVVWRHVPAAKQPKTRLKPQPARLADLLRADRAAAVH